MRLQKHMVLLLLIISIGYNQQSFAKNKIQDTIQQSFDQETFKESLKELPPKEFARLFTQEYRQDSIKAPFCVTHAKNEMLTSQNKHSQYWGYYCLAKWENHNTNFKESIIYTKKATEIAKMINDPNLLLNNYMFQGSFYYDYGKYKESMESYLNAIKYGKEIKYIGRKLTISQNIALLKIEVGDNKGAIELLEGTLKILEEEHKGKFKILLVSIHIALAKSCMRAGNYEKAEYYANRGIDLSNQYEDEDAKAYLYNFLGETNMYKGDYKLAIEFLNKAKEKANEIESSQGQLPFINLNLAKLYYQEGDLKRAIKTLESLEANQKQKNTNFFSLEDMYKVLGKSYKSIDTEKSLYYFEKANEVYTENDKKQNEIGIEIIKKYDLQSLKEELIAAEETSEKTKNILTVSIFIALITVFGLIFFYRKREKNNQRKFTAILKNLEKEKEEKRTVVVEKPKVKKTAKTVMKEVEIIDETKAKLLKKLGNFEAKKSYLSKHCSLNEVAKKLKTNTSYLSKLVNTHKGKSFTAYITDLRVNYAIKRLKEDKKFRSYTIDSIAQEIGFNRSESFSRAFKNKTGLYPSYFIKNLDSQGID